MVMTIIFIETHTPVAYRDVSANQAVEDAALLNRISLAADAIRNAGRLVDMPCNALHTTAFVEEVREWEGWRLMKSTCVRTMFFII